MQNQHNTAVEPSILGRAVSGYQSGFPDHVSVAGDAFVRGNLQGDVQFPRDQVWDATVMKWDARSEPKLSATHDAVSQALASFFDSGGGWVYLTQDLICGVACFSRPIVNRCLKDLAQVGRFERRELKTAQGHRGQVYRLCGEDTDWSPIKLGLGGRTTVANFRKDLRILQVENGLRVLAKAWPADCDLPDSVLTLLEELSSSPEEDASDFLGRMEKSDNAGSEPLLTSDVYSADVYSAPQMTQAPLTERQLVTIFGHQERTGLSVEDIWASWPDIYPGTAPSESLEVLSKSHAFRLVAWLKKQPDAPVPEVEDGVSCTCEAVALAMLDAEAEPSPEAQAMWAGTLEILREALPGPTFDTWLKETVGLRCDEQLLVVRVPSVYTVTWLEQRMYQTILRALRDCSGARWDVRFAVSETPVCPRHGRSGPVEGE